MAPSSRRLVSNRSRYFASFSTLAAAFISLACSGSGGESSQGNGGETPDPSGNGANSGELSSGQVDETPGGQGGAPSDGDRLASGSGGSMGDDDPGNGGGDSAPMQPPTRNPIWGDPGWVLDETLLDERFPDMVEFAKAGVVGGVPYRDALVIQKTVTTSESLQSSLDEVKDAGGGVLLLEEGAYLVETPLRIPSGVVLRGIDEDRVVLRSALRAPSNSKLATITIEDAELSGVEDLTLKFEAPSGMTPIDRDDFGQAGWCAECWQNVDEDLYVQGIAIRDSENVWIDNVSILEMGTDPIFIDSRSSHITLRNSVIDRCYNKGGGGNGYVDMRASYGLAVYNEVARIRHFSVQQQAQFTVILDNHLEVDVNFHNKDRGHNLVELNEIHIPRWHGWDIFATGGAQYGHTAPGPDNILFNNDTISRTGQGAKWHGPDEIYTFSGYGEPSVLSNEPPSQGTFYPVKWVAPE